jgi:nicotinate-nucleotide pyrophosphorylase (carboxylating)
VTHLLSSEIVLCLKRALEEDVGLGDVTTESLVPSKARQRAKIVAKQNGIVAGLDVAEQVFYLLDDQIEFTAKTDEGARVESNTVLADVFGSARALLSGERTALNFLNRMSGIATLTRKFVEAVAHTKATILDTRKTAPGLRALDKLAVVRGGGQNHRIGLYDMVLIKDNHIDFAGSLEEAIRRVRESGTSLEIEIEARTLPDVHAALNLGIKRILLDNMSIEMIREAVALNSSSAKLEVSGNVTLENVREIAETGVDFISVGALTHSAKSFDASMRWAG